MRRKASWTCCSVEEPLTRWRQRLLHQLRRLSHLRQPPRLPRLRHQPHPAHRLRQPALLQCRGMGSLGRVLLCLSAEKNGVPATIAYVWQALRRKATKPSENAIFGKSRPRWKCSGICGEKPKTTLRRPALHIFGTMTIYHFKAQVFTPMCVLPASPYPCIHLNCSNPRARACTVTTFMVSCTPEVYTDYQGMKQFQQRVIVPVK